MKRAAFDTLVETRARDRSKASKWLKHVRACAHEAPSELRKLLVRFLPTLAQTIPYELRLTKAMRTTNAYFNTDCDVMLVDSATETVVYIGFCGGIPVFGPHAEPWPYADKSLWPWTAVLAAVPTMPPDAWACVLAHLDHQSVLNFSAVCKAYREQALRSRHWKHRLNAVLAKAPALVTEVERQPGNEWKWFARLAGTASYRNVGMAKEVELVNACIALSLPWRTTSVKISWKTVPEFRALSGDVLTRYLRYVYSPTNQLVAGKTKCGRNIRIQWQSDLHTDDSFPEHVLRGFLHEWLCGKRMSLFSSWDSYSKFKNANV